MLMWNILFLKVQTYLYSSVSLHDQNPQMTLNTKRSKVPNIQTRFVYGQVFSSCRSFWDKWTKKPSALKYKICSILLCCHNLVHWHTNCMPNISVWNLAIGKRSRSCTYNFFPSHGGRNSAYFRSTGSGFQDTGRFSKLRYLNLTIGQSSTFTAFLPSGVRKLSLLFAVRAAVCKRQSDFKTDIFRHETWSLAKVSDVAHIPSNYPRIQNFTPFCSAIGHFQDIGFSFHFPIRHNVKFHSFFNLNLNFQKFYQ